jgi:ABC-type sugar transport system substrate-binding protein
MKFFVGVLLAFALLMTGCGQQHEPHFDKIARVRVTQAGVVYLDGKEASMESLKKAFAELKAVNGAVYYYRENPQGEAPEQATAVMNALIEAKLPVRLMEKDFDQ